MAIKYLNAKRIRGSSTAGASSTLGSVADGTLSGAVLDTSNEKLGTGCLDFDGSNDRIDIDGALNFSSSSNTVGTIAFWYYNDTTSGCVFAISDTSANEQLSFTINGTVIQITSYLASGGQQWEINSTTISTGAWHHVVCSQDGTEVKNYFDGVLKTTFQGSPSDKSKWISANMDNVRIGCVNKNGQGNSQFYQGLVDDIGLWNVALNQTQVTSLYNSGTGRLANTESTGLKAYYNCDSLTVSNNAVVTDEKATLVTTADAGTTTTAGTGQDSSANVDYHTAKQITGLTSGDIISSVVLYLYNASTNIKVAVFEDSSNAPSTRLGGTTTKAVSISNTNTAESFTLDTSVTVPSNGIVWVCMYPEATIKIQKITGSSVYSNSRHSGTSASYASAFPSTMWSGTGEGSFNVRFGVVTGVVVASTDLPENTLFEQTDNQGVFWLQSNAWVYGGAYEAISCGGATNNEVAFNTTYISSDVAGGAWTASATMPDNTWQLGSSMGDSGRSTFMIWGGHNNTSGDNGELDNSYKFNGTTWGSNIDMARNTNGCANGGGSSGGALCCGGRDGNSGEYLINDTEKFNGTSWSDAGDVDTHLYLAGGDGDNTDYLRVAGTGSNSGANPTFYTSTVQSYNGSSWSGSPTNLGTAVSGNRYYGNTSDGIVIGGKQTNVTADVETYNGSSWTDVASIPVAKRHISGGSNNTLASTKVIIWGGHFDSTNVVSDKSHLWNGTAWTEKNAIPVAIQGGAGGVKGL